MIVSASRRCDLPAFGMEYLLQRLREGYAYSQNPYNPRQRKLVSLREPELSGLVFWTKNPRPLLENLGALEGLPFYVQCTITPYGRDVEPNIPPWEAVAAAVRGLSQALGKERLLWRYDPILLNPVYDAKRHWADFARMAAALEGAVDGCTLSFVDRYRCNQAALRALGVREAAEQELLELAAGLARLAAEHGIGLHACCETPKLRQVGIEPAACIDQRRLSRIAGRALQEGKDPNQRPGCGCARSVDIGWYDSCPGGCAYCYANRGKARFAEE